MELRCKGCGERVIPGRPRDANIEMPGDRQRYKHVIGSTALCPEMGLTASGVRGYVPGLPVNKR